MRRTANAAAIVCALSLCLTFATSPAAGQYGSYVPEGRTGRPNRQLLFAGSASVLAAYAPSVAVAATSDRGGDEWLYAPIIGPWADLSGREGCAASGGNCDNEQFFRALLVGSGVVQLVGLVGIVTSFIFPEYRPESVRRSVKPEIRISPIRLSGNGYGIGAAGRF